MRLAGILIVAVMVLAGLATLALQDQQKKADTYQQTVADCVEDSTGYSVLFYDFDLNRNTPTKQIAKDIGSNENVINDCMGRWGTSLDTNLHE